MAEELNNIANPAAEQPEPTKPKLIARVSSDRLELEIELVRTSSNPLNPVYEDIIEEIKGLGVTFGVRDELLRQLCDRPIYNRSFIVARGKAAGSGTDGFLRYLVKTDRGLKPRERDDGTVDYRDLGFIDPVYKDQPVCEIHAPTVGEDGMDIFGIVLEGKAGKTPPSPKGKNTHYNEDKTLLLASVDGSAEVKNGLVSVIDFLRIPGNVDNSTGDIDFAGDILISGDVLTTFVVTSRNGSISVKGSVEGASLKAAGDIVISQGINGMDKGSIIAGGNLRCPFIQNCTLRVSGNIYSDSIMYCDTYCQGDMELKGKRGRLVGGSTFMGGILSAGNLGSEKSHTVTPITMCVLGDEREARINQLNQELTRLGNELLKLQQVLNLYEDRKRKGTLSPEQLASTKPIANTFAQLEQARQQLSCDLDSEMREMEHRQAEISNTSFIRCTGPINIGVHMIFGSQQYIVKDAFVNSRIFLAENDVRTAPL